MAKKYDDIGGVWRTIGGRRVFIKDGQSLEDAMKESGKFKTKTEDDKDKEEYELYKRAMQDESSIDPMTENSTDWEALDKKYRDRYEKENRIKMSNTQETSRHIRNATSQKSLKAMANAGYAKDITNNSFEANEILREKHGRLERVKTIKGAYGINGAILKSRETGEYFVITARNSNIDYWI